MALEIGSAYAIQVALLQIPALVAFSAIWISFGVPNLVTNYPGQAWNQVFTTFSSFIQNSSIHDIAEKSEFTLVFPQQEFYAIIISVFLCKIIN